MSIVFRTGVGRICPGCRRPAAQCVCKTKSGAARPAVPGGVRVGRETQGRGGKGVTVVTGLALADTELEALARELKKCCGSGGTVRNGVIEIQGEHRDTLVAQLTARGYQPKRSGG